MGKAWNMNDDYENWQGCEWTAFSVTTVGALLVSIQDSALIIALPDILTHLQADFITIMWVLLGYLLITTGDLCQKRAHMSQIPRGQT